MRAGWMQVARRAGTLAAGAWALGFALVAVADLSAPARAAPPPPADAIVCLGGAMSRHGWEKAGPDTMRRALTCAELHAAGSAPVVVFTGYGHDRLSAGEAMARLAIEAGLPEAAARIETDARSTIQNAAFSQPLLPAGAVSVILVSDAYHLPRATALFRLFTPQRIVAHPARAAFSPTDQPRARSRGREVLRESLALWSNLLRVAAYGAGRLAGVPGETLIARFD